MVRQFMDGRSKMPVTRKPAAVSWTAKWSGALARRVVFPLWSVRDHPQYFSYIREFEKSQWFPAEQLRELQLQRLRRLLKHANRNTAFYRARINDAHIDPAQVTFEEFVELPRLTKREIQDNGPELAATNVSESARMRNQTGGSTGSPLQFWVDRKRFDSRLASTVRHNRWAGLRPGDWCAELWGARIDQKVEETLWDRWRNYLLYRAIPLNTSRIEERDWDEFVARIRQRRPGVLLAYAQSAVLFARYLREKGIEDIRFGSIITTAEVLLPNQRLLLEEVFGGGVFDRYGCREVSVIASECELHRGMHVNAEALLVEIVPDENLAAPAGKILVTDLLNYGMPLIRYEIGDVGEWAAEQCCGCGRGLPLLARVRGRTTDFLVLPDGERISGPALTLVVADMPDVRQVQFYQDRPDAVTLRVVPGERYGAATEQELRRRMSYYLKGQVQLSIEPADIIRSESSGKYRFVINELQSRGTARARDYASS